MLLGLYIHLQFLSAHYMVDFEEAFYIGFFYCYTYDFGPTPKELNTCYMMYLAIEHLNTMEDGIKWFEQHKCKRQWGRQALKPSTSSKAANNT